MQIYVGYGFNTNDIPDEEWLPLVEKYDKKFFEEHLRDTYEKEPADIDTEDKIADAIDFIEENSMGRCEYLRDIINHEEKDKAGTDYIVTCYDNFLVFDSIRFADDSKRTEYIRNAGDFVAMISRYINTKNIAFGNLYDGNDWQDPAYWLDT